ncbi:hypothetical protein YC2023_066741 [Brassica napus]
MMAHLDFAGLDGGFLPRPLSRFNLSSTFSCCESSSVFLRVDFSLLLVCSQWWHVEAPGGAMVFVIISGSLWSNVCPLILANMRHEVFFFHDEDAIL